MSVLKAANSVILGQSGGFEPILSSHYHTSGMSPVGPIPNESNYQLRDVDGLDQEVKVGLWKPNNLDFEYPSSLNSATVTFKYILMSKSGKKDSLASFWQSWFGKTYDKETGTPGLLQDIIGTIDVVLSAPGKKPSDWKTITLQGAWPKKLSFGALSQDGQDPVTFTVTLGVIRIDPED